MTDQAAPQEARLGISPVWLVIGVIMIVALYTTIHGLYTLTGSYVYALPFGFVAQSILFIVSLNLGRDIAHAAAERIGVPKISAAARAVRTVFLIGIYLLFFGICWFFAFSTYYNLFLARGDDVQTTASQAVQLGEEVLPELRNVIDSRVTKAATDLHDGSLVTDFDKKIVDLIKIAGRPEISDTIAKATFQETKRRFDERESLRKQAMTEEGTLLALLQELPGKIRQLQAALDNQKDELGELPKRIHNLDRALIEERTGELPEEGVIPNPPQPPPQPGSEPKVKPGQLKPDGFAAKLVPQQDISCRTLRKTGDGACYHDLAELRSKAYARWRDLRPLITNGTAAIQKQQADKELSEKRLAEVQQQLKDYPPLPAPRASLPGAERGPDVAPLTTAQRSFMERLTEDAFVALGDACQPIATALRGLPPDKQVPGLECRPEPVLTAVRVQRRLVEAQQKFLAGCGQPVISERTTDIVNRMRDDFTRQQTLRSIDVARRERLGQTMDEVSRDIITPCLTSAQSLFPGISVDYLSRRARDFEDRTSPRQTDFSLAANAAVLVIKGVATAPAYLGALFAAAQELGILLLSVLRDINRGARAGTEKPRSVRPSDPVINWRPDPNDLPDIAAAKIILRAPGGRLDGSVYLPKAFGEEEKSEVQLDIKRLLRELGGEGLAKPKSWWQRGTLVTVEGVEFLEQRVRDYNTARPMEKADPGAAVEGPTAGLTAATISPSQGAVPGGTGADEVRPAPVTARPAPVTKDPDTAKTNASGRSLGTRG